VTSFPTRRIAMVAYPGVQVLDVTGPLEVFASASRLARERQPSRPAPYAIEVLAASAGPIRTQSGIRLVADRAWGSVRRAPDTLLVAGGEGTVGAMQDRRLIAWLARTAPHVRRLGSVCSGTFVLAEAGLLDGRRATTHWSVCAVLAERYPKIRVETDPIFVRDGNVYSSAGVTAGIDLALALVEEDLGREVALQTARQLVVFLKRPGGQSQFSAQLAVQTAEREPIRELQAWIADHPAADCAVGALARRVAMSPRNFARVFTREVGMTPARFVETTRIEVACRRLEESADGVEVVATRSGFGTAESMRRTFLRTLGVSPSAYRGRFRSALAS
jgi:transcriptional regulator GlxA family with amidase domain